MTSEQADDLVELLEVALGIEFDVPDEIDDPQYWTLEILSEIFESNLAKIVMPNTMALGVRNRLRVTAAGSPFTT